MAVVLGGWGHDDDGLAPTLLCRTADLDRTPPGLSLQGMGNTGLHGAARAEAEYTWRRLQVAGAEPEGRAFHSTTEVARGTLLLYGGLGPGCCRSDVALLEMGRDTAHGPGPGPGMPRWSAPRLAGVPRCVAGRAGHGACFFAVRMCWRSYLRSYLLTHLLAYVRTARAASRHAAAHLTLRRLMLHRLKLQPQPQPAIPASAPAPTLNPQPIPQPNTQPGAPPPARSPTPTRRAAAVAAASCCCSPEPHDRTAATRTR